MRLFLNLFLGAFLATAPSTQPADPRAEATDWPELPVPSVLAHGSAEHFWIARKEVAPDVTPPAEQTVIYVRNGGQTAWRRMTEIPGQIVDAGNRGGQLGLLLDSGDWIAASEDGCTSGAPLPRQTRMLSIAGDGDTFWALGRTSAAEARAMLTPATAPSTRPTSQPAAAATTIAAKSPATTQALAAAAPSAGPPRIVLFVLKEGRWTRSSNCRRTLAWPSRCG